MVQLDNGQISVLTWFEGLENTKYRKAQNFLKNPEIFSNIIVDVSIELENKDDLSTPCEHGVSRILWWSEKLKM